MASQRMDVRVSPTLYLWIMERAKKLGFKSVSAYVRHVFEEMRLNELNREEINELRRTVLTRSGNIVEKVVNTTRETSDEIVYLERDDGSMMPVKRGKRKEGE